MRVSGTAHVYVARLVVGLWIASALSLLAWQARQIGMAPPEDPAGAAVLRCQRLLAPNDALAAVYSDTDPEQLLLAYRLTYTLYPAVTTEPYLTADGVGIALERARKRHPTHLLLLGAEGTEPEATGPFERVAPNARLFRVGR